MFNSESLQEKWAPILEHSELDNISDKYRKAVTSILLENQETFLKEEAGILNEAAPTMSAGTAGFSGSSTATGPVAGFDPVLISLIRRSMPKLIAYDIAGVQPMTGPTGLIFAMRSRYGTNRTAGTEAFFNEPTLSSPLRTQHLTWVELLRQVATLVCSTTVALTTPLVV